jgi:mRNA-degrading endonuclease RelE of RelBE toxin-antitoxin system
MNFDVRTIEKFERQARHLVKKYPSLKEEIRLLIEKLEKNPTCGTPLGHQCYKVRLAIASKRKGKAGGARVITYFLSNESVVYLLSIYDNSEQITITDDELTELLASI